VNFAVLVFIPFFVSIPFNYLSRIYFGYKNERPSFSKEAWRLLLSGLLFLYSVGFFIGHIWYYYYKNQNGEVTSEVSVFTAVGLLNYAEIFFMSLNKNQAQWVFRHIVLNSIIGIVLTLPAALTGVFYSPTPIRLGISGILLFSAKIVFLAYDQKNQVVSVLTGDIEPDSF
jgi:hypothetical protein